MLYLIGILLLYYSLYYYTVISYQSDGTVNEMRNSPTMMLSALTAAGPTARPSKATENIIQTSPTASDTPPASAKATNGPFACPSWSTKLGRPCFGPPICNQNTA